MVFPNDPQPARRSLPYTTRGVPILYDFVRAALFRVSAETAHEMATETLARIPAPGRRFLKRIYSPTDPSLRTRIWGIDFDSPVGLAAGFDKSARAFNTLGALGFGFVEIGTITAHGQEGNPKPRLFRIPADEALLNRMGFNNPGAEAVADILRRVPTETVLGVNIGKSRITPLERAAEDYLRSVELLAPFARYLVVNVSSPNTPGLRDLQEAEPLRALISEIVHHLQSQESRPPVLLKVAPDLTNSQMDQAVDIAMEAGAAGIIAVNTTVARDGMRTPVSELESLGAGGISGRPLRERANASVARIYQRCGGRIPIIGVGGIFDAEDAWQRILAGASLIQIYTGFIYGGPGTAKRINDGLARRLQTHGFETIADAVGAGHRRN